MITPEEFKKIIEDIDAGVFVTQDQVKKLVATIAELDGQNAVLSGSLHFALDTADQLFLSYGSTIAGIIGIRDMGKKRKIAESGAAAATQLRASVQSMILGLAEQADAIASGDLAVDGLEEAGAEVEAAADEVVGGDQ